MSINRILEEIDRVASQPRRGLVPLTLDDLEDWLRSSYTYLKNEFCEEFTRL